MGRLRVREAGREALRVGNVDSRFRGNGDTQSVSLHVNPCLRISAFGRVKRGAGCVMRHASEALGSRLRGNDKPTSASTNPESHRPTRAEPTEFDCRRFGVGCQERRRGVKAWKRGEKRVPRPVCIRTAIACPHCLCLAGHSFSATCPWGSSLQASVPCRFPRPATSCLAEPSILSTLSIRIPGSGGIWGQALKRAWGVDGRAEE